MDSERYLVAGVLAGTPFPTFVVNASGVVTHWNRACELLTGINAGKIIGTGRHREAFYRKSRKVMADLIISKASSAEISAYYGGKCKPSKLIRDGYEGEDYFPNLGPDGKWISFTAAPIKHPDGRILGVIETIQDITEQIKMMQSLKERENDFDEMGGDLERVNEALKASLDHREVEKRAIESIILVHLKRYVFPYLDDLGRCRIGTDAMAYLRVIETNLKDIVSRFSNNVRSKYIDFTPTEIRIADFIRSGRSTKEIAGLMGISPGSVQWHRKNIRKKLGINNEKKNLQAYLNSLSD